MELTETRKIIREVLELVLEHQPSYGDAKYEAIFDSEHDRYQVLLSGWTGMKRSFNIVAQLDIVGRAVWVQQDNTELELANRLIERGIARDQIVLGFQAPYKRGLYGFGTGETSNP